MARRLIIGMFTLLSLTLPAPVSAQWGNFGDEQPGETRPVRQDSNVRAVVSLDELEAEEPEGMSPGSAPGDAPPYNPYGPSPYDAPPYNPYGPSPTDAPAFNPYQGGPPPGYGPGPFDPQAGPMPAYSQGYSPEELQKYEDVNPTRPIERWLGSAFSNTWFRLEYMNLSIEEPGDVLLGSDVLGLSRDNLIEGFFANKGGVVQTVRVPTLDHVALEDNNGVRFTYGVPLTFGSWETSFFYLSEANETNSAQDLLDGRIENLATSVLVNGQLGNRLFFYDVSFDVTYESSLWGADTLLVMDSWTFTGDGLSVRPVGGLTFYGFDESLTQVGVFDNDGTLPVPLTSTIRSETSNFIYGLGLGFRAEFATKWITVGAEPLVSLSLNTFDAEVTTVTLRSIADGTRTTNVGGTMISPLARFSVYGKVPLHENVELTAGWQVLWMSRVARAGETILYNDNGAANPPAIVAMEEDTDVFVSGFSVGLTLILP